MVVIGGSSGGFIGEWSIALWMNWGATRKKALSNLMELGKQTAQSHDQVAGLVILKVAGLVILQ